jgi:aminocarboxymuconate-semialdehyde decarboxylase
LEGCLTDFEGAVILVTHDRYFLDQVANQIITFPDVQQVLTLSLPAPDSLGGPDMSPEFARVANDGMAEMVRKWPKKFPAFIASLPMNNVPAALEEMDRAIDKLGARGIQHRVA